MMVRFNKTHLIHTVLGHSYLVFVICFCLAIICDTIIPIRMNSTILENIGVLFVICGTVLIVWAQNNSKKSLHERHTEMNDEKAFSHGPYRFLRSPTQAGLFLLIAGLGFTIDTIWVVIFAIGALIINILFFIRKQEMILEKRYGTSYTLYKNKVRF